MKNLLFLLLCLSANAVRAQTYDYEFTAIVPLDAMTVEYNAERAYQDSLIRMHTIKYINPNSTDSDYLELYYNIIGGIRNKEISGFYDKNMQDPFILDSHIITPEKFMQYDTIQTNTSKENPFLIKPHKFQDTAIIGYALRHKISYNPQNYGITAKIVSIAFVERIKGYKTGYYNNFFCYTPLNNDQPIDAFNIRDTNIVWAKRATISMPDSVMRTPSNPSDFSKILLKDAKKNAFTTYFYLDWMNTPLLEDELHRILFPTQNDSLAFQENTVKRLRFKMIYYYNKEKIQLGCKIERIGIEQDKKGDFKYRQVRFYIKPEN
jgi:hypothetical protein